MGVVRTCGSFESTVTGKSFCSSRARSLLPAQQRPQQGPASVGAGWLSLPSTFDFPLKVAGASPTTGTFMLPPFPRGEGAVVKVEGVDGMCYYLGTWSGAVEISTFPQSRFLWKCGSHCPLTSILAQELRAFRARLIVKGNNPPPLFSPSAPSAREGILATQVTEQVREWMQEREEDAVPHALRWPLWLKLSHGPWRRKLNVSTPYRVGLTEAGGDPGKTEQGAVCAVSVAQGSRSVRGCQGLREGLATTRGVVHGSLPPPPERSKVQQEQWLRLVEILSVQIGVEGKLQICVGEDRWAERGRGSAL